MDAKTPLEYLKWVLAHNTVGISLLLLGLFISIHWSRYESISDYGKGIIDAALIWINPRMNQA